MTAQSNYVDQQRAAALDFHDRGYCVVPIPPKGKNVVQRGISGRAGVKLTREQIADRYKAGWNIGFCLGRDSGGLVDIDLDCTEAVAQVERWLPETPWVFGRASKPDSHRFYKCTDPPKTRKFQFGGEVLLEIRSDDHVTVVPPGIHESNEPIRFRTNGGIGEPAEIDGAVLNAQVSKAAAAVLLVKLWPEKGTRQDAALALAGGLLREGWAVEDVKDFIASIAVGALDEERAKRVDAVEYTVDRLGREDRATGWPRLKELLGSEGGTAVDRVREWLGFKWKQDNTPIPPSPIALGAREALGALGALGLTVPPADVPLTDGSLTPRITLLDRAIADGTVATMPLAEIIASSIETFRWQQVQPDYKERATPLWPLVFLFRASPDLRELEAMEACNTVESVMKRWYPDPADPWFAAVDVPRGDARGQYDVVWRDAKFHPGQDPMIRAIALAEKCPVPIPPELYVNDLQQQLVSICAWLQLLQGDDVIRFGTHRWSEVLRKHSGTNSPAPGVVYNARNGMEARGFIIRDKPRDPKIKGALMVRGKRMADEFRFDLKRWCPELALPIDQQ